MFWSVEADTSAVLLTHAPAILPAVGNLSAALRETSPRADEQGVHSLFKAGDQTVRLVRLPGVSMDAPLAALVPLDANGADRIEALERLLRALRGRNVADDRRLTRQQRRRHKHMLRAFDGHRSGASYREIAAIIFGHGRVDSEPWKTSTARASVIGLVKDGQALIAGGYRRLLHHRRKA